MNINHIYTVALLGLGLASSLPNHSLPSTDAAPAAIRIATAAMPAGLAMGEFRSEEGRFSITLPDGFGEPEESVSPMPTEGGNVDLKMYSAGTGNTALMFAFANVDGKLEMAGNEKAMLDGARDNVLKTMNGKLIKEKQITIDGHPGRSLVISMKQQGMKFYSRLDMYMVSPFMYQVMYLSDKKSALDSKAVVNYFKSFRLE